MPGVKESIAGACKRFEEVGESRVLLQRSLCILHLFGIGTMRNRLCMTAAEEGFTHVLLLDNDVRLDEPDILVKLVEANKEIIVPWSDQKFKAPALLAVPSFPSGAGVLPINWACLSSIMFQVSVFEKITPWPFFDTMCYCEEETTFQRWRLLGVPAYQQTSASVSLLRPPTNMWELKPEKLLRIQTPGNVPKMSIR